MEFEKLHERYNELLRTHIDHVERTKYLMGSDKFEMMQSLPAGHKGGGMAASVDASVRGITDIISASHMTQSTHTGKAIQVNSKVLQRYSLNLYTKRRLRLCIIRLSENLRKIRKSKPNQYIIIGI